MEKRLIDAEELPLVYSGINNNSRVIPTPTTTEIIIIIIVIMQQVKIFKSSRGSVEQGSVRAPSNCWTGKFGVFQLHEKHVANFSQTLKCIPTELNERESCVENL